MSLVDLAIISTVLILGLSILWSTLTTGISPMMSSTQARRAMLVALDKSSALPACEPIIDLGSGWGTLVIATARQYPQQQVIGYEVSWLPWLFSVIWKFLLGLENLKIYRKDFNKIDINNASILLCYLYSDAMVILEKKLTRERSENIVIISNTFVLPKNTPKKTIHLNDFHHTKIYSYLWKTVLNED